MRCEEYERLVREHLRLIADWKKSFDSRRAWNRVLKAEQTLAAHAEVHSCREPAYRTLQLHPETPPEQRLDSSGSVNSA